MTGYRYQWWRLPRFWVIPGTRWGWRINWQWIAAQHSLWRLKGDYRGMRRVRNGFGLWVYRRQQ